MSAIIQREVIKAAQEAADDECIPVTQAPQRKQSRLSSKSYIQVKQIAQRVKPVLEFVEKCEPSTHKVTTSATGDFVHYHNVSF